MIRNDKHVWLFPNTLFYLVYMSNFVIAGAVLSFVWHSPIFIFGAVGGLISTIVSILMFLPKIRSSELIQIDESEDFLPRLKNRSSNHTIYEYVGANSGHFQIPYTSHRWTIIDQDTHEKLSPQGLAWLVDLQIAQRKSMTSFETVGLLAIGFVMLAASSYLAIRDQSVAWSIAVSLIAVIWSFAVPIYAFLTEILHVKRAHDPQDRLAALEALEYVSRTLGPSSQGSHRLRFTRISRLIDEAEPKELT